MLLSAIGGGLGLLVGYGMMAGLKLALPPFMLPSDVGVTMDGRVLAFTLGLSMVTAVLLGSRRRCRSPAGISLVGTLAQIQGAKLR